MGYGPSHYSIIVLCRLLGLMYCSEREKGEGGTRIPNGFSQPMTIVSLFHLLSYPLFSYPQREHIPLVPSYDDNFCSPRPAGRKRENPPSALLFPACFRPTPGPLVAWWSQNPASKGLKVADATPTLRPLVRYRSATDAWIYVKELP